MNSISWDDFEKVEVRVGTIVAVQDFPKARNPSYQLQIDFGPHGMKKSSAQLVKLYSKEELLGRQIVAVVNFPPKQIANFMSECLVLGVYNENDEVVLISPDRKTANGSRMG